MQGAVNLLFGLGSSAGLGAILWLISRFIRGAAPGSLWDKDGVACGLSLALVAGLIIVMAWTVKGFMALVSEPLLGAMLGLAASVIALFVPMKLFGKLPAN